MIARCVLRCPYGLLYRTRKTYANQLFTEIFMPVARALVDGSSYSECPPYTRARIVSGPFFLPEIPAPRGVPATCAAGSHLKKRLESATFSARAVSILCLACGYGAMVALAKSTTYAYWFVVNQGHWSGIEPRHHRSAASERSSLQRKCQR